MIYYYFSNISHSNVILCDFHPWPSSSGGHHLCITLECGIANLVPSECTYSMHVHLHNITTGITAHNWCMQALAVVVRCAACGHVIR